MNKKRKFFQRSCQPSTSICDTDEWREPSTNPEDASDDTSSMFSNHWRVYMDQAEHFRQIQARKQVELNEKFGVFVDHSPSFPKDNCNITLPDSLSGIDRIEVNYQLKEMLHKENEALSQARFYRDRCESLEQTVRRLQTEKGVRYFWRNKILKGTVEVVRFSS